MSYDLYGNVMIPKEKGIDSYHKYFYPGNKTML